MGRVFSDSTSLIYKFMHRYVVNDIFMSLQERKQEIQNICMAPITILPEKASLAQHLPQPNDSGRDGCPLSWKACLCACLIKAVCRLGMDQKTLETLASLPGC